MFDVYESYLNLRRSNGVRYDWDDLAGAAVEELAADTRPRRYRHIVIDEGQDFSPQMLRSLTMAADPAGSVTFFGDYAQQIYGTRMSWRQAGLDISRNGIEYFKENYRNSRPIARLALAVSQMEYFRDVPDLVEPRDPLAEGPPPATVRCSTSQEEVAFVVEQASRVARRTSVAVLFRDRADEDKVAPRLPPPKVRLHRKLEYWTDQPGIYYGTYHAAKGMEFQNVILPFCGESRLPDRKEVEAFGREEALARDGRLLYVGITRAKSGLVITYTGEPTELLPADESLYQWFVR